MTAYNPHTMAEVRQALGNIADDVVVDGLPLPELPGVRTVFDLRAASPTRAWPPNLRFIVEPHGPAGPVVRVERW